MSSFRPVPCDPSDEETAMTFDSRSGALRNLLWLWVAYLVPMLAIYLTFSGDSLPAILADGVPIALSFAAAAASTHGTSAEVNGLPAWEDVESPDQPLRAPPSTHWQRGGL
jgi:hypothetical protein